MSTYIQNYGFTKTYITDNNKKLKNEIKWMGDYDGDKANILLDINNNGNRDFFNMQLDNNDLINILGIQPVEMSLEKRLTNDFFDKPYIPIALEGALVKRNTRKHYNRKLLNKIHRNKHHRKTHKR